MARHVPASQLAHRIRLTARRALWSRSGGRIDRRYHERARRLPRARLDHPGLLRVAALRKAARSDERALAAAEAIVAGRFTFQGVEKVLGRQVDWYRADLDVGTRLWKTHLHEFSFALDLARAEHQNGDGRYRARLLELVASWSAASPIGRPGFALDAWNARAVATRSTNWAVAAALLGCTPDDRDGAVFAHSLGVHGLFLCDNLEWDLRANHLMRDAAGLVFAQEVSGAAPDALDLLKRQIDEQVLADGCHFERTPLYHVVVLGDLVEVRALLGDDAPEWLEDAIARMTGVLEALLAPGGRLPLFGDSWHGEIDPVALIAAAGSGRVPDPAAMAEHGGLAVLRAGDLHLVLRTGAHGPDYQLGHAHADGLSFELCRGPQPIVTDTGTRCYDPGPVRDHLRSTAAHNTVQIDGEEQLETWGSFRVGRRGRGRASARGEAGEWRWQAGIHDGYAWLPGRPLHHRLVAICGEALLALDVVTGSGRHRVRSALHLHPGAAAAGARVNPLTGPVRRAPSPLHERFNETQEMTEVSVESEVVLPWVGGWLIHFVSAEPTDEANPDEIRDLTQELDWTFDNGSLHVICRHPAAPVEIRWRPASSGQSSVDLSLWTPARPSATKPDRARRLPSQS
jgi:uncharacterized heparinase superfamily protein